VEVDFDKIDLQDDIESCSVTGMVDFILYKGDHYHLTIITDGEHKNVYVDTDDVWDKSDLVGITIAPQDMRITKIEG
jgi:TOBE domain.